MVSNQFIQFDGSILESNLTNGQTSFFWRVNRSGSHRGSMGKELMKNTTQNERLDLYNTQDRVGLRYEVRCLLPSQH
jgi:hypothetical protein